MRRFLCFLAAALLCAAAGAQPVPGLGVYSYDGSGNITAAGEHAFYYDTFGRLKKASLGPGKSQEYTYDRYGNILTIATDGNNVPLPLHVHAETNQLSAPQATYDASGNVETTELGDMFVYDGSSTLMEWRVGQLRKLHIYTASDERLATITRLENVHQRTDWTVRDPSGKVLRRFAQTSSGSWSWEEDYIYRDGQLLAAEIPAPAKTLHFHLDHLGTPRLITGNGGVKLAEHTYYPFGKELTSPAQDAEAMKFTGHERDSAALDYMHARYYSGEWGRFLAVDPVLDLKRAPRQPQNWNRYAYVVNNPINRIDPDGRDDGMVGLTIIEDCQLNGCRPNVSQDRKVAAGVTVGAVAVAGVVVAAPYIASAATASANFWIANKVSILLGGMTIGGVIAGPGAGPLPTHHIATNKHSIFTPQFKEIFGKAGMSLNHAANLMKNMAGHANTGNHTPQYHQFVLRTLQNATKGLSGEDYERALIEALGQIRIMLEKNPNLIRMK